MRILVIGHAYAASYNRRDKLARIAQDPQVTALGAIIPLDWYDRMMGVSRAYEKIPEDDLYKTYLLKPYFSGSQSKHFYDPVDLFRIVDKFKPDIIHVEQEVSDLVLFEVSLLNKLFWHRLVTVFNWENLHRIYNPFSALVRSFNIGSVDFLIGGNQEAIQILKQDGYRGESVVIPQFGVDENRFQPMDVSALRDQLNLGNKFVVGFVGRLVREKGIETLMDAVKKVVDHGKDQLCLVLLSSMDAPDWIKSEFDSLSEHIQLIKEVPHEQFPQYMNLFDLLILPSETQSDWKEQFGRVMIEAMACGVPVVGSDSGAIPEVIGDMGWVFAQKDSLRLAQTLEHLISNPPLLSKRRNLVRAYVEQNYTHDQVVKKTINVWSHMMI